MNENQEIKKMTPDEAETVSGGLVGNIEVPAGYKRVCAHCGSDRVWYWSGMGAPVCHDCWEAEYNFVPI